MEKNDHLPPITIMIGGLIYKQAAINAYCHKCDALSCTKEDQEKCTEVEFLRELPPVQPNLYGYTIEHLALIAIIMEIEGISPEEATRKFEDTQYVCQLVIEEIQNKMEKAMESCFCEEWETNCGADMRGETDES